MTEILITVSFLIGFIWLTNYLDKRSNKPLADHCNEILNQPIETGLRNNPTEWKLPEKQQVVVYDEYIKSPSWFNQPARLAVLEADAYQCRMCSTATNLEVHHITYDNLGHELEQDLATLCNDCHTYTHQYHGPGARVYTPIRRPK